MLAEAGLADVVKAEVLAGLVEADLVGPAVGVGLAELDAVVLPEADLADVVGAGRGLVEREVAAAGTGVAAAERRVSTGEVGGRFDEPCRPLAVARFEQVEEDVVDVAASDRALRGSDERWTTQPTGSPS
jgi:hypothetical protein